MNKWQCDHKGCSRVAYGTGGAVGLRAIGWWFKVGTGWSQGPLFCPAHRPDPAPCHDEGNEDNAGRPCSLCAAEDEVRTLQAKNGPLWGRQGDLVP